MSGSVPPVSEPTEPPDIPAQILALPPEFTSPLLLLSLPPMLLTSSSSPPLLSSSSSPPLLTSSSSSPLLYRVSSGAHLQSLLVTSQAPPLPLLTSSSPLLTSSSPLGEPSYPPSSPASPSPRASQTQTTGFESLISMSTAPLLCSLQAARVFWSPLLTAPPKSPASAQLSSVSSPLWSISLPFMVREVRFMERKVREFKINTKMVQELEVVSGSYICMIVIGSGVPVVTSSVGRRFLAAWCRFLPWCCLVQPLIYRPLCRTFEFFRVLNLNRIMAKSSARVAKTLELEWVLCFVQSRWCQSVAFPPKPPVPPDPPDFIFILRRLMVSSISGCAVSTLSKFGDMSIVTSRTTSASIPLSNQGSVLLVFWNVWLLTSLCPIARIPLHRLKLLSSQLPLYEDARLVLSSPLPLYEDLDIIPLYEDLVTLPLYEDLVTLPFYEDHVTLPLYEDLDTFPLHEDLVTLPLYEDLCSFMEFFTPLCSPYGCVARGVIKGSFDRCLIASVAILEIGNCAFVAVPISGVRSSAQGVILLNNSIVEEIR